MRNITCKDGSALESVFSHISDYGPPFGGSLRARGKFLRNALHIEHEALLSSRLMESNLIGDVEREVEKVAGMVLPRDGLASDTRELAGIASAAASVGEAIDPELKPLLDGITVALDSLRTGINVVEAAVAKLRDHTKGGAVVVPPVLASAPETAPVSLPPRNPEAGVVPPVEDDTPLPTGENRITTPIVFAPGQTIGGFYATGSGATDAPTFTTESLAAPAPDETTAVSSASPSVDPGTPPTI